ncbi:acetylcholine receptor subunit beta-type acr-3-like [Convolutriloba macropyga]|uniref:acetylcholine receptor subunit beta-type acr-3-like n=1 Tax=Convolutriloba macropyga TaxID=536237 RepID=UPI003F52675F
MRPNEPDIPTISNPDSLSYPISLLGPYGAVFGIRVNVITNAIEIAYITNPDVYVLYNGGVTLKSSLVAVKLSCSIDVTYFPFDEQKCYFNIGPVYSPVKLYNLASETTDAYLNFYTENDQWELLKPVRVSIHQDVLDGIIVNEEFKAEIRLRRRPLYYIIVLICPNLLLYLLSTLVFALPVESGDKVSFISTILLAEIVTVSTLNDILPSSSLGFPIVAYFVIVIIIHLSILCICSVIVNKICQAETQPSKFVTNLTSWPKLKIVRIRPIVANSANVFRTKHTAETEVSKAEVKEVETEFTDAISVHTSASCSQLTPQAGTNSLDPVDYNSVWKTFAIVLDRMFFIVHVVFETSVILATFFNL